MVETSGFHEETWLDTIEGHPASDALHVTKRIRRPNFGTLEVVATITDPETYTKPWTTRVQKTDLQLNTDITEFICGKNEKDAAHVVLN